MRSPLDDPPPQREDSLRIQPQNYLLASAGLLTWVTSFRLLVFQASGTHPRRLLSARRGGFPASYNRIFFKLHPELLTIKETAAELRRSTDFIRLEIERKHLGHIRMGGRLFCSRQDIAQYLERCRRPAAAEVDATQ
jgi:excisionase family DNA binding protein